MKRITDIIDLSVLEIAEANEIAVIKKPVVDNATMQVVGFAVTNEEAWYQGQKFIRFNSVIGIAVDILTIGSAADLLSIHKEIDSTDILAKDVEIFGSRVITNKGNFVGHVEDFFIDDSGNLSLFEILDKNNNMFMVAREDVCSLSKSVLVIKEGYKTIEAEQAAPVQATDSSHIEVVATHPEIVTEPEEAEDDEPVTDDLPVQMPKEEQVAEPIIQEPMTQEPVAAPPQVQPESVSEPVIQIPPEPEVTEAAAPIVNEEPTPTPAAGKMDDKQKQFILGKKSSKTITTDSGIVIIEQGSAITEETIQKAKLAGKFMDLLMNLQH